MKYAKLNATPDTAKRFNEVAEMLVNTGRAASKVAALDYILDKFEASETEAITANMRSYTSEDKLEIFTGLVYEHNVKESKKKSTERNYIHIPSINFIATETGLNAARLDKGAKESALSKMAEQAKKLKFDGSENDNSVVDAREEVQLKKRIVKRRSIIIKIVKASPYAELFGY